MDQLEAQPVEFALETLHAGIAPVPIGASHDQLANGAEFGDQQVRAIVLQPVRQILNVDEQCDF
nr:hypothetical protein [Azotobacter beijerinckii]